MPKALSPSTAAHCASCAAWYACHGQASRGSKPSPPPPSDAARVSPTGNEQSTEFVRRLQSTLFNALVESGKAEAANFPFCTIEPNVRCPPSSPSRTHCARAPSPDHQSDYRAGGGVCEIAVGVGAGA